MKRIKKLHTNANLLEILNASNDDVFTDFTGSTQSIDAEKTNTSVRADNCKLAQH